MRRSLALAVRLALLAPVVPLVLSGQGRPAPTKVEVAPGWLETLEKIDALEASVIMPGHGPPLHDKALLHATIDVFRTLLRQGKEARWYLHRVYDELSGPLTDAIAPIPRS